MKFSDHFNLNKGQAELDFVDVDLDKDKPLFVDPFALSLRMDPWSMECHNNITEFFQRVVTDIRAGQTNHALETLRFLREPNETRLGMSSGRPRGAGIGMGQARQLCDALSKSSAVRTGFINSLQECELMVEGIGPDKISDLTTNIIRKPLAEYTEQQCVLLGIPLQQAALPPYYDVANHAWASQYFPLPVASHRAILLLPKLIARYEPSYQHGSFYQDFIVNYLIREELNSSTGLVRLLKNGARKVYRKDIIARFPCTKENIAKFSREHPEVLKEYRKSLISRERQGHYYTVAGGNEEALATALITSLMSIPPGNNDASSYHSLMTSILELLFYPHLSNPRKEQEIHQGRKRIDVAMNNVAIEGVFYLMHAVRNIECPYVFFECKNYRNEIANPELDQMGGRFSTRRGRFGIICCRSMDDRAKFVERCRDTFRDDRGLIVVVDDTQVTQMLTHIIDRKRDRILFDLTHLVDEVCLS